MASLEKRVVLLETAQVNANLSGMTSEQLEAYLLDPNRGDWIAAMLEKVWRTGSRLPLNRLTQAWCA